MPLESDELSEDVRLVFSTGASSIRDRQMDIMERLSFYISPGKSGRMRTVKGQIDRDLDNLKDASDAFYKKGGGLEDIYRAGLKGGGVDELTPRDHRLLLRLRRDGQEEMRRMFFYADRDFRRVSKNVRESRQNRMTFGELEAMLSERGLKGRRYIDGRMVGIHQYSDMALRTRSAIAYNRGLIEAGIRNGATAFKISDGADCGLTAHGDSQKANGMVVTPETALGVLLAHPHCITGDTKVEPIGDLLAVYRIPYSGAVVEITTASDHRLTIGPNHPVLTSKGWVSAKLLEPGDEIVNSASQIGLAARPDFENVEPAIEDLFNASLTIGAHSTVVAMPDQFHGDGASAYGEVDVIDTNGLVMNALDSSVREKSGEVLFKPAVESSSTFLGGGDPLLVENSIDLPTPSSVSGLHVAGVEGLGANLDTLVSQLGFEDLSPDPILQEHILEAGARDITLDRIVKVRILDSSVFGKHVYDLETSSGAYIANGTIVHNCQRTFRPTDDKPDDPTKKSRSKTALKTIGRVTRQSVVDAAKLGVAAELYSIGKSPQALRLALRTLPKTRQYQTAIDDLAKIITRAGEEEISAEEIREHVMAWGDVWLEKGIIPEHVAKIIQVKVDAPDKAVNDAFYSFSVFRDLDIKNSMSFDRLNELIDLESTMYNAMFDTLQGAFPKNRFVNLSFPHIPTARDETDEERQTRDRINEERKRKRLKPIRKRLDSKGGKTRGRRVSVNLGRHIRGTTTFRPGRGFINHLTIPPHGLLRMGFSFDQDTGFITPTLRLVPPGPIHIGLKLNRSAGRLVKYANLTDADLGLANKADLAKAAAAAKDLKRRQGRGEFNIIDIRGEKIGLNEYKRLLDETVVRVGKGKINSVTGEIRVVTPDWKVGNYFDHVPIDGYLGKVLRRSKMGLDFSGQFNFDLKKLGLRNLKDITSMKLEDFKKLGLEDMKIVSLAAEYMASGGSPWQLSRIFRIGVDRDVRIMWALANKYIDLNQGKAMFRDLKAQRARRKFFAIDGDAVPSLDPDDPGFKDLTDELAELRERRKKYDDSVPKKPKPKPPTATRKPPPPGKLLARLNSLPEMPASFGQPTSARFRGRLTEDKSLFDDASAYTREIRLREDERDWDHIYPRSETNERWVYDVGDIAKRVLRDELPQLFLRDLEEVINMHHNIFPDIWKLTDRRQLKFMIGDEDDEAWDVMAMAYFEHAENRIVFNPNFYKEYGTDEFRAMRTELKRIGWMQPDKDFDGTDLPHEMGHWLTTFLQVSDYEEMMDKMHKLYPESFPGKDDIEDLDELSGAGIDELADMSDEGFEEVFQKQLDKAAAANKIVAENVSTYATTNTFELFAEAWADYTTSAHPSTISSAIGDSFVDAIQKSKIKQKDSFGYGDDPDFDFGDDDGDFDFGDDDDAPDFEFTDADLIDQGGIGLSEHKVDPNALDPLEQYKKDMGLSSKFAARGPFEITPGETPSGVKGNKSALDHLLGGHPDLKPVASERRANESADAIVAEKEVLGLIKRGIVSDVSAQLKKLSTIELAPLREEFDIFWEYAQPGRDHFYPGSRSTSLRNDFNAELKKDIDHLNSGYQGNPPLIPENEIDYLGRWWLLNRAPVEEVRKLIQKYPDHAGLLDPDAPNFFFTHDMLREAGYEPFEAFQDLKIQSILNAWAFDTNTTPMARLVQRATGDLFGLDTSSFDKWVEKFGGLDVTSPQFSDLTQAEKASLADTAQLHSKMGNQTILKAIYDHTQTQLAGQGMDEITLYRGAVFEGDVATGEWAEMAGSPLASWTVDPQVAHTFARGANERDVLETFDPAKIAIVERQLEKAQRQLVEWTERNNPAKIEALEKEIARAEGNLVSMKAGPKMLVMSATFPRWRIFATSRTGMGCVNEGEFVVFSDKVPSRIRVVGSEFIPGLGKDYDYIAE